MLAIAWLWLTLVAPLVAAEPLLHESVVWAEGEAGRVAHVYGLAVTTRGTALAFTEGRIRPGDTDPHHILLRRSTDRGATWRESQVVVRSDGKQCFANPTAVVERSTGRVFLFYALNRANQSSTVLVSHSDDDGLSWSEPVDLTAHCDADPLSRPFHLPGPGHGIQTAAGRLIMPVWHRFGIDPKFQTPLEQRQYTVSVLRSDDRGRSWQAGGYVETGLHANESRVVELSDGRLLLNARRGQGQRDRCVTTSSDGGAAWSKPEIDRSLPPFFPTDAGLIRLSRHGGEDRDILLFSHPADTDARRTMTVRVSLDGGRTWPHHRPLNDDGGFYSDLVELDDGTVGLLYGRGGEHAWFPARVEFARFNLPWVLQHSDGDEK